jgi:hypothetical protein
MNRALSLASCAVLLAACNPSKPAGQTVEDSKAGESEPNVDPELEAEPVEPEEPEGKAASEGGEGDKAAEAGAEGAAEAGAGAETGGAEAGAPPSGATVETLVTEVKSKKTKDDRARAALDEAEKLGAEPAALAAAANDRGETLMSDPDRATAFFEYARDKDKAFAEASFNLAKLAANAGDLPVAIEHLTEVKKRGGKKLLKKVETSPEFFVLIDDPDVQALLK